MAPAADPNQANDFPVNAPALYASRQPYNNALQNWAQAPPAPADLNGQHHPEGYREDIVQPIRDNEPGRMQDPHIDLAYQGAIDYHPQLIANPINVFPDIEHAQGQPNVLWNQIPQQQVAPYPPDAAIPHPFIHRVPTPNQRRGENLRQLANRYMDHPEGQIRVVSTEEGVAGGYKTVIIVETPDVP